MSSDFHSGRFWRALTSLFTGAEIEGDSGFVKLMRFKFAFFEKKARPALEHKIEERVEKHDSAFREELYEKLYDFFEPYFCESGSIYFRHVRAWRGAYDRVYDNGEGVALSWKTRGLWYVKSDKILRSMPVQLAASHGEAPPPPMFFDASEIEHKKNNERRDFLFAYAGNKRGGKKELCLKVSYPQNGSKTKIPEILKEARTAGFANLRENDLRRAFSVFHRQTEVDFFIHQNACSFLREQFDLWMHDFAFRQENQFTLNRFKQLQALRDTAFDIIGFIGQFEDELGRVWQKPKFPRKTHYVITADRLPPALRRKIASDKAFHRQIAEWRELREKGKIALSNFNPKAFERGDDLHKFLPIDTRHFPRAIEDEILAQFKDIGKALDGELCKSENWQALNTLRRRFSGRVKCVYIDPPFNLDSSDQYSYRTNYKDACWATILDNRLGLARDFISDNGGIFVRCDYNGNWIVRCLLDQIFGRANFKNEIKLAKSARITEKINRYHNAHDSLFFYAKSPRCFFDAVSEKRENRKWQPMHLPGERWSKLSNEDAALFSAKNLRQENGTYKTRARIIFGKEMLPPDGRHWALQQAEIFAMENKKQISMKESNGGQFPKALQSETQLLTDNWMDKVGYANDWGFSTENHERVLSRVLRTTTHEGELCLDFFAGSGTMPAVAQKLGRKWLAVEMGEHFYSVMLPRMKSVLAGCRSGISDECGYAGGGFFKYGELEQYEETLANAVYKNDDAPIFDANKTAHEQFLFLPDEKLARAVLRQGNGIKVNLSALYPDIDVPELLANALGQDIVSRGGGRATFANGMAHKTDPARMSEAEKREFIKIIRSYIWWGE